MRHKVICIQPLHPEGMKILNSRDDLEVIVPESPDPATWANFLPGAEAICVRLTKIPRAMMEAAPNLKIISRHGVGLDTIDVAAATERGVIVATIGLANAPSVVEHTIAMMYALAKRLHELDRAVREGDYWRGRTKLISMDVAGRTVLIIGLGRIGSRLAKALNGLGLKCLGVDPAYTAAEIEAMGCEPVADFRTALPRADFVTVHCPLQDDTRNMIGAAELAADEALGLRHQLRAWRHRRRGGAAGCAEQRPHQGRRARRAGHGAAGAQRSAARLRPADPDAAFRRRHAGDHDALVHDRGAERARLLRRPGAGEPVVNPEVLKR